MLWQKRDSSPSWLPQSMLVTRLLGLLNQSVHSVQFIQLLSHVQLFVTPWTAARQPSLSITNSQCLLKLMPIESVMLQGQGLWVRQTWICLVLQTWVWHKSSWWGSPLTPPKSCQNVHRTGEIDSWMAQTEPYSIEVDKGPDKKSMGGFPGTCAAV